MTSTTPVPTPPPAPARRVEARPPGRTWIVAIASVATVLALAAGFFRLLTLVAFDEYLVSRSWTPAELAHVTKADISNDTGHIRVITAPDGRGAHVDLDVTDGLFRARRTESVVGDTLEVRSSCPLWFATRCQVEQLVQIPDGLALAVEARHGSVDIGPVSGPLTLESRFGAVRLRGVGGSTTVRQQFGETVATEIRSSTFEAVNRFGSTELAFAVAPDDLRVVADFGAVSIELPDDGGAYRVTGTSSFGDRDIQVRIDPDSDRTIHIDARFGAATIRYAR